MLGTVVNVAAIIAGSLLGVAIKGGIPARYSRILMDAIGLSVVLIGLKNAFGGNDLLIVILSLVVGCMIGEFLGIEKGLDRIGQWFDKKLAGSYGNISQGFVAASLIYCVGAMAIVGSLESGLSGNHQTLFAKSVLDGITSIVMASTMGIGVMLSSLPVLLYQGAITLSAVLIKPLLTPEVISQMSATGGLLIMAIGFNLLEIRKINVGNMLPAIFIPILFFAIQKLI
ncbi:MAG: DUF554 domain-containing protein [Deltaproteobacteria bacterium]|nr:MAG: DUF554 domain-containing protein [Deltaproteobacteria bacterium]